MTREGERRARERERRARERERRARERERERESTEVLANDADVLMEREGIPVVVFCDLLQKPVCESEKVHLREAGPPNHLDDNVDSDQ